MRLSMRINRPSNETGEYANREYFCRLFQKDLASLYQLAFLLTGDHDRAQSILVAGIDECTRGNPVFQQRARSWARRVIIKDAIRLIAPVPYESDDRITGDQAQLERDVPGHAIARLSTFHRFVFIMSVLERIPDRECAVLLGCGTPAIVKARIRALQTLGRSELSGREIEKGNPALAGLEVA